MHESAISVERNDEVGVIRITGALDGTGAVDFSAAVFDLLEDRCVLVACEMSRVTYMSSSAVGTLFSESRKVKEAAGNFVVVAPNPLVRQVLDLLEVRNAIPIAADLQEATDRLRAR